MRHLIRLLLILLTASGVRAQVPPVTWNTDLATALQLAKVGNKPVLAVFSGSDWCKPCIMLRQEVLDQPEFEQYARDRFVLARFDFPRNKKHKLSADQTAQSEQAAAQLNKEGVFPLVVLLSPEGKVLARTGYRPGGPTAYDEHLGQLLTTK
ncbi:MAG: thioredoxin family protein [Hymenobacteraceae bacterium]|nr:thioredoxin family protein [Hymenobacteraceae bacterium]